MMNWLTDVCKYHHMDIWLCIKLFCFSIVHMFTRQQMQQMHNRHKAAICETTL